MKNTLTFKKSTLKVLYVQTFANSTPGHNSCREFKISNKETSEEIHQKVLTLENEERTTRMFAEKQRSITYSYWVTEFEKITDNRSTLGHINQSSTKFIKFFVPTTYVRGQITTLGEAILKVLSKEFNENTSTTFLNFVKEELGVNLKLEQPPVKHMKVKIVIIPGDGKRETFFERFNETDQIKVFSEKELLPFKKE